MRTSSRRAGFTLIEMLVVAVLGSLVLAAVFTTLVTNQRAYRVQNAEISSQQNIRGAVQIMMSELREISATGGDLAVMNPTNVRIRTMKEFGVVCQIDYTVGIPTMRVMNLSDRLLVTDSLFVFADNDEARTSDDTWLTVTASVSDTSNVGCETAGDAQNLTFGGLATVFSNDSVRVGAPIRSFEYYTWGETIWNGQYYLGRRAPGEAGLTPVAGPLKPVGGGGPDPIQFRYLDENGDVTAIGTDVAQVEVTVRSWSPVTGPGGQHVVDSTKVRVNTRN